MTELRSQDPEKQAAHRLLDEVKHGIWHSQRAIAHALTVLGEPIWLAFDE
jgi:hypothetical protein